MIGRNVTIALICISLITDKMEYNLLNIYNLSPVTLYIPVICPLIYWGPCEVFPLKLCDIVMRQEL